jgi:predicted nucleic acid-binding protein
VIVVSDSSPLVILAKLHQFGSLLKLFGSIYITRDVFQEIVVAGEGLPGSTEVRDSTWIEVKEIDQRESMQAARLKSTLGAGEMSSIWLAKQMHADRLLLDDYKARRLAREQGLKVIGTIGLLELFYSRGYLSELHAAFRQLIAENAYVD